jgi:hypothetical protein
LYVMCFQQHSGIATYVAVFSITFPPCCSRPESQSFVFNKIEASFPPKKGILIVFLHEIAAFVR